MSGERQLWPQGVGEKGGRGSLCRQDRQALVTEWGAGAGAWQRGALETSWGGAEAEKWEAVACGHFKAGFLPARRQPAWAKQAAQRELWRQRRPRRALLSLHCDLRQVPSVLQGAGLGAPTVQCTSEGGQVLPAAEQR